MRYYLLFIVLFSNFFSYSNQEKIDGFNTKIDTAFIDQLNIKSYKNRLTDPQQTLLLAKKAKKLAETIKYKKGEAEATRVIGIGYYYTGQRDSALSYYFLALNLSHKINALLIEAKVYNNLGNMWIEFDNEKALSYFNKSLILSNKLKNKDLTAGIYLNIATIYYRRKNYNVALEKIAISTKLFKELNNPIGITQCLQNSGVMNFNLNRLEIAEKQLLEANSRAKENELNTSLASINLTLTSIYTSKGNFEKAEKFLKEGLAIAKAINDRKKAYDYTYTNYELELKRKNFEKAIIYLKEVHDLDSMFYQKNNSANISLIQQTLKQQQTQKENELVIENQRNVKKLFIAVTIVAILSFFVIFLLVKTNKKSKKSNLELQTLNEEVSKQKSNVERINQKLEEIITERTKDLIVKNQKLSEYSSHLSHQIRAPIATLKGLVMLIQDGLVESHEVTNQIKKCVDEIDNQIMDINDALHDPTRYHLNKK